jgi:hypothetical protein
MSVIHFFFIFETGSTSIMQYRFNCVSHLPTGNTTSTSVASMFARPTINMTSCEIICSADWFIVCHTPCCAISPLYEYHVSSTSIRKETCRQLAYDTAVGGGTSRRKMLHVIAMISSIEEVKCQESREQQPYYPSRSVYKRNSS